MVWMFASTPNWCTGILTQGNPLGGGTFGKWFGDADGALMNGVSGFVKEIMQSSLVPSALWG